MPIYKHDGPVDCTAAFDTSNVRGKLAIVTGGKVTPSSGPALSGSQMLNVLKVPMGLARHMSGPSNLPGELLVLTRDASNLSG